MTPEERIEYVREYYPDYLTQKEFAEAACIGITTAYRLNRDGIVPYEEIRSGFRHHYRIRKEDVLSYLRKKYAHSTRYHQLASASYLIELLKDEPEIMSMKDVMRITGVSKSGANKWASVGKLPAFYYMHSLRIKKCDLIIFMASPDYQDSSHRNKTAERITKAAVAYGNRMTQGAFVAEALS